jgi:hypothetical protein
LALTSPTSGGRSVGIDRWRTKVPEFCLIGQLLALIAASYHKILRENKQADFYMKIFVSASCKLDALEVLN